MENFGYRFAFVAFIDILGWRDIVERSVHDPSVRRRIGSILESLSNYDRVQKEFDGHHRPILESMGAIRDRPHSEPGTELKTTVHYGQFSDAIIVSVFPAAATGDRPRTRFHKLWGCSMIISNALHISRTCLKSGFLVRGGIASGQLYHRDTVAFGPALTQAYLTEQSAVYPRIVIADELRSQFKKYHADSIKCEDNTMYLDVFKTIREADPLTFRRIGVDITDGLERFEENPHVMAKYVWLSEYYNSTRIEMDSRDRGDRHPGAPPTR